jgi:hypothetical protein
MSPSCQHTARRGHKGESSSVQDTYLWSKEVKYTGNCITLKKKLFMIEISACCPFTLQLTFEIATNK